MEISEFNEQIKHKQPPAPEAKLTAFEASLGCQLPEDYRQFLIACNGGHIGGRLWFHGPTPEGASADAGVHHIGGFREESYFSLVRHRDAYKGRIPNEMLWIMDDPFGNAICIGLTGTHRGRIYFWDHEREPDSDEWDGKADTAGNVQLLANSFTDFVAGLQATGDE
jgi:hypothetical protein